MEHVGVLDKFIEETRTQMADKKKLKHMMVQASRQPQKINDKKL